MHQEIKDNYNRHIDGLAHQKALKIEFGDGSPTELRLTALNKIERKTQFHISMIAAYELVAEELGIVLTDPEVECSDPILSSLHIA